jgi:hypothetical protein
LEVFKARLVKQTIIVSFNFRYKPSI